MDCERDKKIERLKRDERGDRKKWTGREMGEERDRKKQQYRKRDRK